MLAVRHDDDDDDFSKTSPASRMRHKFNRDKSSLTSVFPLQDWLSNQD